MTNRIDECDVWLFRELYVVLGNFADNPQYTMDRIGGGRISVPNDQANDLGHFYQAILAKYPKLSDVTVMRAAAAIDEILSRRSRGGEAFDEEFWTNAGFLRHDDWLKIPEIARTYLIR